MLCAFILIEAFNIRYNVNAGYFPRGLREKAKSTEHGLHVHARKEAKLVPA